MIENGPCWCRAGSWNAEGCDAKTQTEAFHFNPSKPTRDYGPRPLYAVTQRGNQGQSVYHAIQRLSLLILLATASFAQTTSQLTGAISDSSGGIVPGVKVAAVSEETGGRREVTSDVQGLYTMPALLPGRYRLEVEKQGFKAVTRSGIVLVLTCNNTILY